MINDYFNIALNNIRHRKLRAWLTIFGIVIGVAAIIALISLSLGLQASIEEQFESFGSDRILISAKGFQGPGTIAQGLSDKDVETVEKVAGIEIATQVVFRTAEVKVHNQARFPPIIGIPSEKSLDYFESTTPLEFGRNFNRGEKNSVLIGSNVANGLFNREIRVNNNIEINGNNFRVVGIFEETGNRDNDNWIVIPLESFREAINIGDNVDIISAKVKPGINIELTQERIERALERDRNDENFEVQTPTQILEQINEILGVMQFVLVGIAAISLLVGGVGITNSMYTSILERTKDIGIMKAIGAQNKDILFIFLIESGLMGLVGGIFGVIIGTLLSYGISQYATQSGFKLIFSINPGLVMFGLLFAFCIGMISGMIPARQASKLKPVDALRYE